MTPIRLGVAAALVATGFLPLVAAPPRTGAMPRTFGSCSFTTITHVTHRLEDGNGRSVAGSGSAVELANGVSGVSYEELPAVNGSRRGDHVMTCLVLIPRGCPQGDNRGRIYTTTNLRTMESWTLPDSQHSCGGA